MRFRKPVLAGLTLIVVAAFLLTAATCSHAQKDDPFDYLRKDERLSAELTLRLNGEALKDVVDVIEAATGAKISVDRDISEDKVTIFCKGQPASEVMVQIAKLFGYHFRRERIAGKLRYTLFRDDATRALERKLRRQAIDDAFAEIDEFATECAREAQTPEGFERLRESLPSSVQQVFTIDTTKAEPTPEELAAIEEFAQTSKKVRFWSFCAVERGIPLLYSNLSQEQVETLKGEGRVVFASYGYPGGYRIPDEIASAFADEPDISKLFDTVDPVLKEALEEQRRRQEEEGLPVIGVRVEFGASVQEGQAESRELSLAATVWRLDEDRRERLCGTYSVGLPIGTDLAEVIKRSHGAHRPAKAPPQVPGASLSGLSDATLQTVVKLSISSVVKARLGYPPGQQETERQTERHEERQTSKTSPAAIFREKGFLTVSHLIEELDPQVRVSMIADHYDKPYATPIEGETFGHAVASMQGSGRDLTVDGEWLRLRSRTWYLDRSTQVPNHLLLRWLDIEDQKRGFALTGVAEMAILPKDQFKSVTEGSFGGVHSAFASLKGGKVGRADWSWIKAFALNTAEQRASLLRGDPILVAAMPRAAQQSLMEALQETAPGAPWESVGRAAFHISVDRTAPPAVVAFRVAADDWSTSHALKLPAAMPHKAPE